MQQLNKYNQKIAIIAGMPRAATTFLYHTLPGHPSVFVPSRKETEYFSINYDRGQAWYLGFFNKMPPDNVGFDISPMYFLDKNSPARILSFNPAMKVILIIRDPIDWIISFFNNRQANTYKKMDFESFIDGYIYKKDGKKLNLQFKNIYSENIVNYCNTFGPNLLLCDFKKFTENPLNVLRAIEKFVGIKPYFNNQNFENKKINASDGSTPKFINILMHKKIFADVVVNLFPKNLIMRVREKLQTKREKNHDMPQAEDSWKERKKMAGKAYAEEINFVSDLFSKSGFVLGNGRTFEQ